MDEFNEESRLENMIDNEWDEIDWSKVNSDEHEESIWDKINWHDVETGEQEESVLNEIDWEESNSEKRTKTDSNNENGEFGPEQLDPNEGEENYEGDEYEQSEMESDDESNYDPHEYGNNFEQEEYSGEFYENSYAESMNTILLSENQIYEYLQEYIELMGEKENEVKQGEQAEVDDSTEEVSELEKFLEEERERIQLEQQQADLDEELENKPDLELVPNEEEIEQEQKEEGDTQINSSEEIYTNKEEELEEEIRLNPVEELQEDIEEVIETESETEELVHEEEVKNQELKLEELESNCIEEKQGEQEHNLELENDETEEYEKHQVESKIKEEFEIKSELIVHEEELVSFEMEREEKEKYEECNREQELPQVLQELEVKQETNLNDNDIFTIHKEEELEREITSLYKHENYREIDEFEYHQQELEEILDQNRKIELHVLLDIGKEENTSGEPSKENYERVKKLYHQQTGKRPIYANKETKSFKEWLEQINESVRKLKVEQSKEQEREQKKEEDWINFLKTWIKEVSEKEISLQIKNEVIQILEQYNELDELAKKFQELYKQEQLKQISKSEKIELRALIKKLQESYPSNIVLFTNLRVIKNYLTHQKLNKSQINQLLNHFFTLFSPIKQLNQILTHKHNLYTTTDLINDLLQIIPHIDNLFKNLSKTKLLENISVIIFNKGKHFLKHIISKIQNSNNPDYNPNYKFSLKVLKIAEDNMKDKFESSSELVLEHLEKYRYANRDLKHYFHEQWKKHNPNLNSRFFERLDNIEKSYWFGFLCSDGSITSGNDPSKKRYQIAIEISEKDRDHLVKFCRAVGLNPTKIGKRTRALHGKKHLLVYIIFTCKPMFQDLKNLGLSEFKKGIELKIKLKNNNLSYSLLLGIYDGDGKEGRTIIYSTNYSFLLQIKNVYGVKSEIRKREVEEIPDDLKHKIKRTKPIYEFALNPKLLNKMMKSYPDSLVRKRKTFSEQIHTMENMKNKIKSPENLEKLIKKYGKQELAKKMNVSFNTLHKLASQWNVSAKKLSPLEILKAKIKNKENLIKKIEENGKEKTAKELKTGYKTLLNLIDEWNINAKYLNKREKLKVKIGSKENLERLLVNSSFTQLAKKFGVGRNTLKRLYDEWEI